MRRHFLAPPIAQTAIHRPTGSRKRVCQKLIDGLLLEGFQQDSASRSLDRWLHIRGLPLTSQSSVCGGSGRLPKESSVTAENNRTGCPIPASSQRSSGWSVRRPGPDVNSGRMHRFDPSVSMPARQTSCHSMRVRSVITIRLRSNSGFPRKRRERLCPRHSVHFR